MPEIKTDLFSSLRRVFYTFSFSATVAMPEMEFVSTCRYASTLLNDTNFQDLSESVQTLFIDVVEMAVIVLISRVFPAARFSVLPLVDCIPEAHEAVRSFFDLIDVEVSQYCSYGPQLRMAAISQLFEFDTSVVNNLHQSLVVAQEPRTHDSPLPTSHTDSHANATTTISSPSSLDEMNTSLFPTWSTPKSSTLSSAFPDDTRENSALMMSLTRAATKCDNSLDRVSPIQTRMQYSELRRTSSTSGINFSVHENASPPVSQTILEKQNLCSSDTGDIPLASAHTQNLRFPSLQVHDHSRRSSMDLATVPSELLVPYVARNHAGFSLRRPSFRFASPNPDVFPRRASTGSLPMTSSGCSLPRAAETDRFGSFTSSSVAPVDSPDGRGKVPRNRNASNVVLGSCDRTASGTQQLSVPVSMDSTELEYQELGKGKRERQTSRRNGSIAGIRGAHVDEGKTSLGRSDSPKYDEDHPFRSKRQRTAIVSQDLDIGLVGLSKGETSPMREIVSRVNKENRDSR